MENRANGWWESLCSVLVTHWLWLKEEGWCDEIQVLLDREMTDCQRMKHCCSFRGDLKFYLVGPMSTGRGLIIMWLNDVHNSDFKRKPHTQLVSGCLLFCHAHILPILTSTPWNICLKKRPLILIACLCLTPAGKGCSWEGMKDEEENFTQAWQTTGVSLKWLIQGIDVSIFTSSGNHSSIKIFALVLEYTHFI